MRCFGIVGSVKWQFLTDVSGQHRSHFQGSRLPQNVGNKLTFYAVQNPKTA